MSGEWQEEPLPEVIDFLEGPGILAKDFRDEGVPLVRLAGLERGGSILRGCNYLDPKKAATKWAHFRLAKGDILLSTSASLGRIAVVKDDGVGTIPYTGIIRMRPRNGRLIAPFIRYLLEGPDFQRQTEMFGVGSVIKHFGPMHLRQMTVRFPPPDEQLAIAHILGILDDKIELNSKINQTLEQIAQAIFKSWFVDFDPVRAKIEAKEKGENPERAAMCAISGKSEEELEQLPSDQLEQLSKTAALFPDELEESTLGMIPKGWEAKPLDKIAIYTNGLAMQKFPPRDNEQGLPVIKIAEMRSGFTEKTGRSSEDLEPIYIVEDGDILFSWSGSLLVKQWNLGRGALNQHLFKVTSSEYPKWFYYFSTITHLPWFQSIAAAKATTMGHIQRHHLSQAFIAVDNGEILKAAGKILKPLLDKSLAIMLETRILLELRDSLLPKLLSGEIDITEHQDQNKRRI